MLKKNKPAQSLSRHLNQRKIQNRDGLYETAWIFCKYFNFAFELFSNKFLSKFYFKFFCDQTFVHPQAFHDIFLAIHPSFLFDVHREVWKTKSEAEKLVVDILSVIIVDGFCKDCLHRHSIRKRVFFIQEYFRCFVSFN